MAMPTRRAVRPDSRHHRDARRAGLYHSGRRHGMRGIWNLVGLVALVALIIAVLFATLGSQHHAWVMPVLYASVALLVLSILSMLFLSRG